MNREIKFRGKRVDGNGWVCGSLIHRPPFVAENESEYAAIVIMDKGSDSNYNAYLELEVIPESVGQFTGLKDKNGKEIFEGDIIKREGFFHKVIVYHKNGFYTYSINNPERLFPLSLDEYDFVFGNLTDNLELL